MEAIGILGTWFAASFAGAAVFAVANRRLHRVSTPGSLAPTLKAVPLGPGHTEAA